jgi:SOS-response transcriptional repressor LexA
MSGRTLPVPDFLDVSRRSFWYQIPLNDASMVAKEGLSLVPGAIVLIDLEKPIIRGKPVLAKLMDHDEPLIREFQAAQSFEAGGPFILRPLNPAYDPIEVKDRADCLLIGAVYFFGSLV